MLHKHNAMLRGLRDRPPLLNIMWQSPSYGGANCLSYQISTSSKIITIAYVVYISQRDRINKYLYNDKLGVSWKTLVVIVDYINYTKFIMYSAFSGVTRSSNAQIVTSY